MMYKLTASHRIFLHEFAHPAWSLCSYCLFQKQFSFDALEAAINEVVRKNDALRMIVNEDGMAEFEAFRPRRFDRIKFSDESSFLTWAREHVNKSVSHHPGMWTAFLIEIDGKIGIFNIGHHIMCDALNVKNLYHKIAAELDGRHDEGSTYAAYFDTREEYLQSRQHEKDRRYWESALSTQAPLAFGGRPMGECENITVTLPSLDVFCADTGLSKATVMYAVTGLLLMRLQGLDALSVGIPVLGRTTRREIGSLGLFMHDMPMIMHGGEKNFLDLAQEVENSLYDLFRHQQYDMPEKPLFDVSVDYSEHPETADYQASVIYNNYVSTAMEFHFLQGAQLELTIRAQNGLFRNLHTVANTLCKLLQEILSNPKQSIWLLPIADLASAGIVSGIPDVGLYSLIEQQKAGRIIEGNQERSVAQLRQDAEKIDAAVHGKKRTIGVLCERSYAELASIYGIIRGGNAYLPISPDYPVARIKLLLEQSGCDTVLVQRKYRHMLPDALVIEEILEGAAPDTIPAIAALPDDPLYVIFTSGSTGTPKGAMVSNRSAVNRIQWMCKKYFTPETVVMLKTPFTFDVSVWEIFGFALGGFSLYILPPEDHYLQDRVIDHIRKGKVTDLHFVPTVFGYFLDALKKDGNPLPSLKGIFLSGEALTATLVNRAPAPVHNLYGPTECAVDVTYYDCKVQEIDPVPIGKPIDNCQMYVLDQQMQPLPVGIVGQIFIGGTPVGMGYVNDPEKTANAFVLNPFSPGRLYRTGDLGYWQEDGQLIYVGRADNQIKIHGQRIELGEIEAAMNTFVSSPVVVLDEDRLIAFYTGDENTNLREQLSHILPRHMIPSRFVCVDTMPLTTSGKADRQALLMMPRQESMPSAAPATQEEEILLNAVAQALHLSDIGTTANFYELGGDSLSAIFVITALHDMGYDLSVADFLKSETLEAAAQKMTQLFAAEETSSAESAPVAPIVKAYQYEEPAEPASFAEGCTGPAVQGYFPEDIYDLTPAQLGMYQNWAHYHLRYTVELGEKPDMQRLEKAVNLLAQRHPILRSKFVELGDGTIKQLILKDWQQISDFDRLFRVKPNGMNLTVETHHIILDGWSLSILAKDLIAYYHAPETSVLPTTSFGRYSQWLHSQPSGLPYWKALLSGCGVSSDLPHISNSKGEAREIAEELISSEGVVSFAQAHRISVNTVLEAAFAMLLQSNSTVLFCKVISGRNASVPGISDMVGPFVNTVPVYIKRSGNILSQIHEQSIMTNKFGFTPLAELYTHTDLRRINILFVFNNFPYASAIHLIDYKDENEFDLTVSVRETEDGYLVRASYAPEKYERAVIEEMIRDFDASLKQLLSGQGAADSVQTQSRFSYEAPIGETESTICRLFAQVIGIDSVGRQDNFYDLGGTSLNMMELLCETPLDTLSPSEFMQNPTPAGLAQFVSNRLVDSLLIPLYTPENATAAYVLFPYGGGDAAAYTALVAEFRKRNASAALLFVPWGCDYNLVADALWSYPLPLYFYSHCAGAAIAMQLLDRVDCVEKYIAGASIPPEEMQNIWPSVPDEMLLSVLYEAGMPKLPQNQAESMLGQFRANTDEYFRYFAEKNIKTPIGVTLILSQKDMFTQDYPQAAERWNRYIEGVDAIHYMNTETHYFQSANASELAEILLKEVQTCCQR